MNRRVKGRSARCPLVHWFIVERQLAIATLASALVATTALTEGHGFSGFARPAGVLVAGVLAWRKAPFLVVVLAAAAVTALLRVLGVS